MRSLTRIAIVAALAATSALLVTGPGLAPAQAQANAACNIPTAPAATADQTAWQLFVAINCRGASGKPVWATWIEQSQLYPANAKLTALAAGSGPHLHGSVLGAMLHQARIHGNLRTALALNSSQCTTMQIAPPNVVAGATICEEVYINPSAQQAIQGPGYNNRKGQMKAAQTGTKISFPSPAIEVKIDWLPSTDFKTPPFSCTTPTPGLYLQQIGGVCYALVAMHITSKLLPNWLWTTFEPQNVNTNPYRCDVYGPCRDAWGATPAVASGAGSTTTLTQPLATLMQQAALPASLQNYRLVVAQTTFTLPGGGNIVAGNSIIEYEAAGVPRNQSSCISCHSMSSVNAKGTDGASLFATDPNPMGPAVVLPAGFITRGFLWSLGLACPDPTKTGLQGCK
jgi:hypothetical protein